MPVVRFAEFEFDFAARELRTLQRVIRLQEQPAQVLDLLLEKAGSVVTREELHRKLWPTKVYLDVDHGLNNAITRLREALGETRDQPRLLETIPRVGYRFNADILSCPAQAQVPTVALAGPAAANSRAASPRFIVSRYGLVLIIAVFLSGGMWVASRYLHERPAIRSIAVLPFENLSAEAGQEYLVDGMTDTLITDLANLGHLNVISRTTAMHYKGLHVPVAKIAADLKVDAVLEGSIARNGQHLRVNVRLVNAADDHPLWAHSYDREFDSVIALQSDLAQAVADAIAVTMTPAERRRFARGHAPPSAAYDDYLRGMYFVNQRTKEGELASIPRFESAIAADAKFADAYAGLAQAYALLGGDSIAVGLKKEQAKPKSLAAARKAVELDPQLSVSWTALGMALGMSHQDGVADPQLQSVLARAVALSPSDAWVHKRYSDYLYDQGQLSDALRELEHSIRLDPLNSSTNCTYGETLISIGKTEEGLALLRRTVEFDPQYFVCRVKLGWAYMAERRYAEALPEFRQAESISPGSLPAEVGLAEAEALTGQTAAAAALLEVITPQARELGRPSAVAVIEVLLHHKEQALQWLQQCVTDHDRMFFDWSDDAGWLKSDPDFQALARRFNPSAVKPPDSTTSILRSPWKSKGLA
jgi:TolB-like protein/DNA-binding winged helix-turn-helix (wHTH) protein/cytochrome c-type biogenesis protein CcmH/NrfG